MGRADTHLAVCAIAAALILAAANSAIAVADTPDSPGTQNTNTATSDSDPGASAHTSEPNNDMGAKTADSRPAEGVQTNSVATTESSPDEPIDEPTEKPVDKEACPNRHDKTITPAPVPEAPQTDFAPLPQNVAPALEAPPPVDLPPVVPSSPVAPDTVDATTGDSAHHSHDHEVPVLRVPLLALSPMPPHILGTSVAPRGTSSGQVASAPSRSEPRPWLLRASTGEPLRQPPTTTGLSAGTQIPKGHTYGYMSRSLAGMAAGAMPGVAGILMMTAGGICVGYRQARAQLALIESADRFL